MGSSCGPPPPSPASPVPRRPRPSGPTCLARRSLTRRDRAGWRSKSSATPRASRRTRRRVLARGGRQHGVHEAGGGAWEGRGGGDGCARRPPTAPPRPPPQVAELHAAALAEDAAVFDYDAHYDAIQAARDEPKRSEKLKRESRYIAGLLGARAGACRRRPAWPPPPHTPTHPHTTHTLLPVTHTPQTRPRSGRRSRTCSWSA